MKYEFVHEEILTRALTRRAFVKEQKEHGTDCEHQEALAVLGDAILNVVITGALINKSLVSKGEITEKKKEYVREETLYKTALGLRLQKYIITNKSEEVVKEQPRVLAETLEAVFGAIFLDAEFERVSEVILPLFHL